MMSFPSNLILKNLYKKSQEFMVQESLLWRDQCWFSLHFLLFHNLQIKRMIVKDQSQDQNFISP